MCLACGSVGDLGSITLVTNWVLALSPIFGVGVLKLYRLISIRSLIWQPHFYLKLGLALAGYNALIYAMYAGVITFIVDYISVWRWVALTAPVLFIIFWLRFLRQCFRYRKTVRRAEIWYMTVLSLAPFFAGIFLGANFISAVVPYISLVDYPMQWYLFYKDIGVTMGLGLLVLQVAVTSVFLEYQYRRS